MYVDTCKTPTNQFVVNVHVSKVNMRFIYTILDNTTGKDTRLCPYFCFLVIYFWIISMYVSSEFTCYAHYQKKDIVKVWPNYMYSNSHMRYCYHIMEMVR